MAAAFCLCALVFPTTFRRAVRDRGGYAGGGSAAEGDEGRALPPRILPGSRGLPEPAPGDSLLAPGPDESGHLRPRQRTAVKR